MINWFGTLLCKLDTNFQNELFFYDINMTLFLTLLENKKTSHGIKHKKCGREERKITKESNDILKI